jgi:hypothetical protein
LDLRDRGILDRDRSAKSKSFVKFPLFPAASRQNTAALQGSLQIRIGRQLRLAGRGFEREDVSI